MLGYVYVMSNVAMPGLYKIGCTSRHPDERASDLNNTSVPSPFVVEYCMLIDNYTNIERLVHKELSAYNFGKEFFKHDLDKCILSIKKIAGHSSQYSEEYRDKQMKARVEGREAKYLRELYEQRERERRAREEQVRRKIVERAREQAILQEREERKRTAQQEEVSGKPVNIFIMYIAIFVSMMIAFFVGKLQRSWLAFFSVLGVCLVFLFAMITPVKNKNKGNHYVSNSKQEIAHSREQDTFDHGIIFMLFYTLVIIPFILYLLTK